MPAVSAEGATLGSNMNDASPVAAADNASKAKPKSAFVPSDVTLLSDIDDRTGLDDDGAVIGHSVGGDVKATSATDFGNKPDPPLAVGKTPPAFTTGADGPKTIVDGTVAGTVAGAAAGTAAKTAAPAAVSYTHLTLPTNREV